MTGSAHSSNLTWPFYWYITCTAGLRIRWVNLAGNLVCSLGLVNEEGKLCLPLNFQPYTASCCPKVCIIQCVCVRGGVSLWWCL